MTTNATLTGTGAKCALLTTEGVRDALEMRRGIREEQYNNRYTNVRPLVPRARCASASRGRIDRDGSELDAARRSTPCAPRSPLGAPRACRRSRSAS